MKKKTSVTVSSEASYRHPVSSVRPQSFSNTQLVITRLNFRSVVATQIAYLFHPIISITSQAYCFFLCLGSVFFVSFGLI